MDLVGIVRVAFRVMYWLILCRVLLSWVSPNPYNPIIRFIYEVTEPVLAPFRRLIPAGQLPLDFSPLIALLVLSLLERLVIPLVAGISWGF